MEITRLVVGMVEANCYIALNPQNKEAVIVDPGDNAPKIIETCGKLGASVKAILLTHGHFDHVMAMEELFLHLSRRPGFWRIRIRTCPASL